MTGVEMEFRDGVEIEGVDREQTDDNKHTCRAVENVHSHGS